MKRKIIGTALIAVFAVTAFFMLQHLLVPKYVENIPEGSMIEEYYSSSKNHDVLILGDCEVYENISTVALWEQFGITSYIRGSADQSIWQSYYLLEDTLRYETPQVVILSILSMKNDSVENEAYNRMTLDKMKWSRSKLNSIKVSMTPEESLLGYLFPIVRFHSRWSSLTKEDFKYYFNKPKVTANGYLMQTGVKPVTTVPKPVELADYSFSEKNFGYLEQIKRLCDENNIELVLFKAPSIYPIWYEEYNRQIEEFADENGILYINSLEEIEAADIDFSTDTFDYGQHLNVYGAEKLSRYIGNILLENYGFDNHYNDKAVCDEWEQLRIRYYEEKRQKLENVLQE